MQCTAEVVMMVFYTHKKVGLLHASRNDDDDDNDICDNLFP